jgi:PAS domain S-box-containing protein
MKSHGIRRRLLYAFIGLATVPVLLVSLILGWLSYRQSLEQAHLRQQNIADRVAIQVDAELNRLQRHLEQAVQFTSFLDQDEEGQRLVLRRLLAERRTFNEVVYMDAQGSALLHLSNVMLFEPGNGQHRHSTTPAFQIPREQNRAYYGPVYYDAASNEPLMQVSIPVRDIRSGSVAGVLLAEARIRTIWQLISSQQLLPGEDIYLQDQSGRIVAHRNPSIVLSEKIFSFTAQQTRQPGLEGGEVLLASSQVSVGQQPFTVIAERYVDDALATARQGNIIGLLVTLLSLLAAVGLIFPVSRRIVRPIIAVSDTARAIRDGDLQRRVEVAGDDEICELALSFNSMTERLRDSLLELQAEIAEREEAEAKLAKAHQLLDSIVENIPTMVFLKRASDLSFALFNKAGEELLGIDREQLLGRTDRDFFPAEQAELFAGMDHAVLRSSSIVDIPEESIDTLHGRRMLHTRKIALRNELGEPEYLLGISEDITEQKQAEKELEKHRVHLQELVEERTDELERQSTFVSAVLENISDGVVACDKDGLLSLFNRATRELHGIEQETLPPEEWSDHYRLFRMDKQTPLPTEEVPLFRAYKGERFTNTEMAIQHKNGDMYLIMASGQPIYDTQGNKLGAVVSMHDITKQKQAEAALLHAKLAAESANRAKSRFLANMSHELRTPLNAILGFAQILSREEGLSGEHRHNLDIINRAGHHLLDLINDVLEISRIEAGQTTIEVAPFDLAQELRSVAEMSKVRADSKGLVFSLDDLEGLPRYVSGDVSHLKQVLINLLGNAIKYTEEGEVRLRVSPLQDRVLFEVADTGPGIPGEQLENIFQAFYQTAAGAAKGEGSGLGLTISRQYVQMMGGTLQVSSEVGKGSTFSFAIPLPASESPVSTKLMRRVTGLHPDEQRRQILVAEDNEDNREYITTLLQMIGFEVRAVENGQQAIDVFKEWTPRLILMDMRMPVLDGYAATRRIRQLPDGDKVKIVAMTASAFREDQPRIFESGCDEMVPKPVQEQKLFEVIGRQMGGLRYSYEAVEEEGLSAPEPGPEEIDLKALPQAVREELAQAALELDVEATRKVIERIRPVSTTLAGQLEQLLSNYRFDELLRLSQSESNQDRS